MMRPDIHNGAPRGIGGLAAFGHHLAALFTGAAGCAFIDDLGRPRLVQPVSAVARSSVGRDDASQTKITLEFDAGAEPISGSLQEDRGVRRPFAGWLGLAAALEATLGGGSSGQ